MAKIGRGRPRIAKDGRIRKDGLTERQAEWLAQEAERTDTSGFELLRRAVDRYIRSVERSRKREG